jgi:hypothetical protein
MGVGIVCTMYFHSVQTQDMSCRFIKGYARLMLPLALSSCSTPSPTKGRMGCISVWFSS